MRASLSQQIQSSLMFTSSASQKLIDAQNHAVSGKRIMRPSDDVPGTNRALSLRSSISTVEQFANNITVSKPVLDATQSALLDLVKAVRKVRDKALEAANTDFTGSARDTYARELDDILKQMVDLANTKHTDQFVFSGTKTDVASILQQPGAVPFVYQGNDGIRKSQVLSWVSLQLNIPGSELFNFDGSAGAGTTDLFTMVDKLKNTVLNGSTTDISGELKNIDANLDHLLACTARVGSWVARMDSAENTLADTQTRLREMLSETEDIDLPSAVVELKTQENVYQTALSITSRMLNLSLASLQFS